MHSGFLLYNIENYSQKWYYINTVEHQYRSMWKYRNAWIDEQKSRMVTPCGFFLLQH
jgi:hypothetical protein